MHARDFLAELDAALAASLDNLGRAAEAAEPAPALGVPQLLTTALKKELEAAEEAALWIPLESNVRVKVALMRQCGDEARHYRLIRARLDQLGVAVPDELPLADGPSPMYRYLRELGTTVERVAAGPFAREGLALVLNRVFIDHCEAQGDGETARLYREVIQPDEAHHHALGRELLGELATTDDEQELARKAVARTLQIAGELQEIARLKKGIARAPGC
jgi:uncharacterized ferritin-like protein (DUF455 family)